AKKSRFVGSFGSLQGIKIHFREFLYNLCAKRNKLLGSSLFIADWQKNPRIRGGGANSRRGRTA
ncbi:MAG: hypothetical protein LBP27_02545, partial [Treponema sp.]|nr:hypothetical protein [Treponema sp.]